MQEGKWIEKRKELKIIIKKKNQRTYLFLAESAYGRRRRKPAGRITSTAAKSSWKTTKAAVEGLRKGKMVEGIADKEETGGFVWFEWQKREFFLALVFQSEAIRKEEEKGGQILLCIELHAKALQPFD